MLTNLQHFLIGNKVFQICFDVLNLFLPVCLVYFFIKKSKITGILSLAGSCFALVYNLLFSAMSVYSPEIFIAWIFIPLIFYAGTTTGFYFRMHSIRIIFIIIFFSSALWKIRTGAVFNAEQMSAILIKQHGALLAENRSSFFSGVITYLINNKTLSFCLYWAGFLLEFIFVAGLFTKRFDRLFIIFLFLFLVFDYALMGINYFPWTVFAACFYFSKYKIQFTVKPEL